MEEYPVAPLDSDGFAVSFSLDDPSLLDFYSTYGFVVIRDLVTPSQIDRTIDEIWTTPYLLGRENINRSDPSTFENNIWPTEMDLAKGI